MALIITLITFYNQNANYPNVISKKDKIAITHYVGLNLLSFLRDH